MEPAVPFALLGIVQLLSVAGWVGLGGAACFPPLWRRASPALVVGAAVLAVADALTVTDIGSGSSATLSALRISGFGLVAISLALGVLQPRTMRVAVGGPLVILVAPLGAPTGSAVAAGLVGLIAAGAAVLGTRNRRETRDPVLGRALALAMAAAAAAAFLSSAAGTSGGAAIAELGFRAAATAAIFAVIARMARRSVLAKVVATTLAGVAVMAAGAVGVVGTTLADSVLHQQANAAATTAQSDLRSIQSAGNAATQLALIVDACQQQNPRNCPAVLNELRTVPYFAYGIRADGTAQYLGGQPQSSVGLTLLAHDSAVQQAFRLRGTCTYTPVLLPGTPPQFALVGIAPGTLTSATCATPTVATSTVVAVYGILYTSQILQGLARPSGYDETLIADGQILASTAPPSSWPAILHANARVGPSALGTDITATISGGGNGPTVSFAPLQQQPSGLEIARLAVSQPAGRVLAAERSVLSGLFVTIVVVLLAAAAFALAFGQRLVAPIRRLTAAARLVRRGDLAAASGVVSADEVGSLARAFDAMTESLRGMTDELRAAVQTETVLRGRMETVLNSMRDGLITADAHGRITGLNPAATTLLERAADELVGRELSDAVPVMVAGKPALRRDVRRLDVDGELVRDGGPVPVRIIVEPLSAERVTDQGVLVVLRDTTRDREIERLKTEFLSNVSHELRTPLTPIRGYTELLRRRRRMPAEEARKYLSQIHDSTMRMQHVVDLLVDVAALEAGRLDASPVPTKVSDLVDECLTRWRRRWPHRAGDLHRRVSGGLPAVHVDRRWVGKALDELADNAIKYSSPDTVITVFASAAGPDRVLVGVRDSGPGIPEDQLSDLLADFVQADASETRRVGGLGLGLSFVRRLADGAGFGFVARSAPHRGSEFGLELPVVAGAERARRNGSVRRPRSRTSAELARSRGRGRT